MSRQIMVSGAREMMHKLSVSQHYHWPFGGHGHRAWALGPPGSHGDVRGSSVK